MLFINDHKQANICLLFFFLGILHLSMRHFWSSLLLLLICFSSPSFINIRLWWNYNKQQNSFSHSKTLNTIALQHDNYTNDFTLAHRKLFSLSVYVLKDALLSMHFHLLHAYLFWWITHSTHIALLCFDVSLVFCLLAHINAISKPQNDGKYEF